MPENASFGFPPRFQGSTFEQMVESHTENFGPFEAWPASPAGKFLWKSDTRSDGTVTVVSAQYSSPWQLKAAPETPEWLSIILPRSGAVVVTLGRRTIEGTPGGMLLVNSHEAERFDVKGEPHLSDVLRLDWKMISKTIAAVFEIPFTGALELLPAMDLSTQSGQLIGKVVQTFAIGMRDNGLLLQSPVAMSHLTEVLADLVVRTIPHRFSALLDKKPLTIAPRHVRHAIDFMQANIDRPIVTQTVAEAAGVSIRALENGFRVFRQTTPAAYLRTMRLQAVRQDLLDPSNHQSVREICQRWGFSHFGRFSAIYRAAYGENPSDTRKRSFVV
ncbi:AraC-like DNA-binding protein [Rhizobium sp. BK077]|uniref:AraC family transcriptional regulator n=1 Tax=Rhizobium TaxID=379 RepID=UPI00046F7F99|nr:MULTISPECIES: helix-turn-helix transcriptional regulator [Rhizobium]KZS49799.1 AraC family transcriptional regulator [Rhizobium anhuiense bv. trifolii]MBB3298102.1 AraC-like DNA-binding protein [Rhizobium sp. BK112]MBB3366593.1 AraC-like DNA-binding protein [Rhizobium sp. BK077]MBB4177404.1 AraC-like DNA-binding protein [Rhizobium sp. BK109]